MIIAVTCGGPQSETLGNSGGDGGKTAVTAGVGGHAGAGGKVGNGGSGGIEGGSTPQAGKGGTGGTSSMDTGRTSVSSLDAGVITDGPVRLDAAADVASNQGGAAGSNTLGGDGGIVSSMGGVSVDAGAADPETVRDPELVAYFRLDDAIGSVSSQARDSSNTMSAAVYFGSPSAPVLVAGPSQIKFANVGAARFSSAQQQSVVIATAPAALKPAKGLTVSAWYRTSSVIENELVSMGDSYAIRVQGPDVVFIKRVVGTWEVCTAKSPTNDGGWHHIAVSQSETAMFIFVDGINVATCGQALDITYDLGGDFVIGRHGTSTGRSQFEGDIDDVRVYNKSLPAERIAELAAGNP